MIFPSSGNEEPPVSVGLRVSDIMRLRVLAERAEIGGISHIRAQGERVATLGEDQFVGMCGAMAVSQHLFGSDVPFFQARAAADAYPTAGDGGSDFLGINLDIKSSRVRREDDSLNVWDYNLVVRPAEHHADTVYLLALVLFDGDFRDADFINVALMGWRQGRHLRQCHCKRFGGELHYECSARELHKVMPLVWYSDSVIAQRKG